jgi:hypothetical protein
MNYISFHTLNARTLSINVYSTHLLYFLVCFTNFWPINKHVFVLEIDIQIPRHIFIIWCMRRRFSAVLPLPRSDTLIFCRACARIAMTTSDFHHVISNRFFKDLVIQRLYTVVWRQTNVSRPDKTEKIAFFCSSVTAFTVSSLKISITWLRALQTTWKTSKWPRCASRHFDTTGSMSLQRNSALSMRTICFSKPVSELALQTGLTRPQSWTEEVSDLGRGLFHK